MKDPNEFTRFIQPYSPRFLVRHWVIHETALASFTKEDNPRLAKRPSKINGRLTNLELTSLVKDGTGVAVK